MKCAPLAMVLALAALINCTSCRKCSNCYVPIPEFKCYRGPDTIFYAANTLGISDTIDLRNAEGYICDTTAFYVAINKDPVCSKKEIENYETQTGVTCKEME